MDTDFWIDGVTASIIVVFGILSGIFFAKEYKKNRAGLLKDLRWITPLAGLLYLGVFLDFIFVLSMETNFPNSNGEVPIISYIWFPPLMYFVVNFNLKILNVQGKKKILIPLTFVSIVYYIFITINPESSFYWKSPENPGEALIDYNSNLTSPAGIILALLFIPVLLYLSVLFFKRAMKASGVIRRKFLYMVLASIAFCIGGIGEGLTVPGGLLILVRISFISSFLFLYLALKSTD